MILKQENGSEGVSVRIFRPGALALLLAALPLGLAWSSGGYGAPPPGIAQVQLGAHWIASWLFPITAACVLSFGTAGTGADARVAAAGRWDPRIWWWREKAPVLACVVAATVAAVLSQSMASGEPFIALLVPSAAGLVVAICASQIMVARFGAGPGTATAVSGSVTAAVVVLPYHSENGGPLALDPTLFEWSWHGPQRLAPVSSGLVLWTALAIGCAVLARFTPRDVSRLGWVTKEDRDA